VSFSFVDPWHLFLPRDGGHVVAFAGSGGKTSLQLMVAELYQSEGLSAVLTNTTQCEVLPEIEAVHWDDLMARLDSSLPPNFYLHNGINDEGKWRGLAPEQVDELGGLLPDHIILVEVDGARKKPLKLYREGEPIWPSRTSLAIMVIGVGAVGGKVGEVVHRWGTRPFKGMENLHRESILEWRHLKMLLIDEGGYLDQLPQQVPTVLALAGVAGQDDSIGLFEFVGQCMADARLPLVVFCSRGQGSETESVEWEMRTAAADRDEQL